MRVFVFNISVIHDACIQLILGPEFAHFTMVSTNRSELGILVATREADLTLLSIQGPVFGRILARVK